MQKVEEGIPAEIAENVEHPMKKHRFFIAAIIAFVLLSVGSYLVVGKPTVTRTTGLHSDLGLDSNDDGMFDTLQKCRAAKQISCECPSPLTPDPICEMRGFIAQTVYYLTSCNCMFQSPTPTAAPTEFWFDAFLQQGEEILGED
jgi:hypothetical protein